MSWAKKKKKRKKMLAIVGGKSQWKLSLSSPNAGFNRQRLQSCYFKYVKKNQRKPCLKNLKKILLK